MFESSLIQQAKRSRRAWLSLPMAVAVHLALLGSIAFASYWSVADVSEPSLNVVFHAEASLPPLFDSNGEKLTGCPRSPEGEKASEVKTVQPEDRVADELPETGKATVADLGPVSDGGSEGSGGGEKGAGQGTSDGGFEGVSDGVERSVGQGEPRNASGETWETVPLQFGGGMTRPGIVHQVQPRYSKVALQAGVEGTVIIEAVIDEKGNVTNARVLRGLPMGLDRAAVEAVAQWRFTPATLQGKAVKVFYTLTVNFRIDR